MTRKGNHAKPGRLSRLRRSQRRPGVSKPLLALEGYDPAGDMRRLIDGPPLAESGFWEDPGEAEVTQWVARITAPDGFPALDQDPVRLCCGQRHMTTQCPDGLVMCCLCFSRFPVEGLNKTADGTPEDVCLDCAEDERRAMAALDETRFDLIRIHPYMTETGTTWREEHHVPAHGEVDQAPDGGYRPGGSDLRSDPELHAPLRPGYGAPRVGSQPPAVPAERGLAYARGWTGLPGREPQEAEAS